MMLYFAAMIMTSLSVTIATMTDKQMTEMVNTISEEAIIKWTLGSNQLNPYQFHNSMAFIYSHDPSSPIYNISKSFCHFEQAIQAPDDDEFKSAYFYNYACDLFKVGAYQCYNTNCTKNATQRCTQCKCAHYCSRKCQVSHWKSGHKEECKHMGSAYEQRFVKVRQLLEQALEIEKRLGFLNIQAQGFVDEERTRWGGIYGEHIERGKVSDGSIHSLASRKLALLLSNKFGEHQQALEIIREALSLETARPMSKLLKDTQQILHENKKKSKGNKRK